MGRDDLNRWLDDAPFSEWPEHEKEFVWAAFGYLAPLDADKAKEFCEHFGAFFTRETTPSASEQIEALVMRTEWNDDDVQDDSEDDIPC